MAQTLLLIGDRVTNKGIILSYFFFFFSSLVFPEMDLCYTYEILTWHHQINKALDFYLSILESDLQLGICACLSSVLLASVKLQHNSILGVKNQEVSK